MAIFEPGPSSGNARTMGTSVPVVAEDSDWEYEYNEDGTEDYYITLDLTTQVPQPALKADNRKRTTKRSKAKTSEIQKTRTEDGEYDIHASKSAIERSPGSELQILNLHSENPLVKLDNTVFSCYWSTDLGTQFYVAQHGTTERPLRQGKVIDVVGISRNRLMGRPTILRERRQEAIHEEAGASMANAISVDEDYDEDVDVVAETPDDVFSRDAPNSVKREAQFVAARESANDPGIKAQADFLARLSAIKRRKGETDIIPLYGVKEKKAPQVHKRSNKPSISAPLINDLNGNHAVANPYKRGPYKSRRRSSNRRNISQSPPPEPNQAQPEHIGEVSSSDEVVGRRDSEFTTIANAPQGDERSMVVETSDSGAVTHHDSAIANDVAMEGVESTSESPGPAHADVDIATIRNADSESR